MFSALTWIARCIAVLALVAGTVLTVGAFTYHVPLLAVIAGVLTVGAFMLAWTTDGRIHQDRRDRKALELRAWSGTEIAAPLHWFKWLALLGVFGGLTVLGALTLRVQLPIGIGLVAFFGSLLLAWLVPGLAAIEAGYVVRFDPLGVHYGRTQTIPWRDVQAVDLQLVSSRGFRNYRMVITLQPQAARSLRSPGVAQFMGARLRRNRSQLLVRLTMAAIDPDLLLNAARVIAGRAGVPTGQGWSGFTDPKLSAQLWDADFAARRKRIEQTLAGMGRPVEGGAQHG